MARLTLCADDFAFSPDVSRTIVALSAAGKLNATSCMTVMPGWAAESAMLRDAPATLQLGLHLVLTLEVPVTAAPTLAPDGRLPTIDALHRRGARRLLPPAEVAAEIAAQFDRFEQALGRAPDFVDGHQHCHAIAGIRELVLAETARRAPRAWLRSCVDRPLAIAARPFRGKAIASAFHSRGLAVAARRCGLSTNDGFAGHYGFAGNFAEIFPKFLRGPGERHLIMCHPGAGHRAGDSIAAARLVEAAALAALPIADIAATHGLAFAA